MDTLFSPKMCELLLIYSIKPPAGITSRVGTIMPLFHHNMLIYAQLHSYYSFSAPIILVTSVLNISSFLVPSVLCCDSSFFFMLVKMHLVYYAVFRCFSGLHFTVKNSLPNTWPQTDIHNLCTAIIIWAVQLIKCAQHLVTSMLQEVYQ